MHRTMRNDIIIWKKYSKQREKLAGMWWDHRESTERGKAAVVQVDCVCVVYRCVLLCWGGGAG